MEIGIIFKIAAVGIIVAILNQVLVRTEREEYGVIVTIAGLLAVLMLIVPQIAELFATIKAVFDV